MAYFNYFIKCIIRKFVNFLFKPKILLTFLVVISLLFILQITSRAEWTDTQIQQTIEDLESIASMTYNSYKELGKILESSNITNNKIDDIINNKIPAITDRLEWINGDIVNLKNVTQDIYNEISNITTQLTTLNTEILNIYNSLEENQKELLTELKSENNAVLEELNMIRDAINGSEEEETSYTYIGKIVSDQGTYYNVQAYSIDYEPRYSYTIKLYCRNPNDYSKPVRFFASDNLYESGFDMDDFLDKSVIVDSIPPRAENYVITYNVPSSNPKYIYIGSDIYSNNIEFYRSIKGIVESLNDSNSLQQEQNQLQQQQNQLQQEQNNFLRDDNVTNDFSNLPSDTTQDITGNGFDNIFQQFYTTFTTGSAQDVVITIPFTNKSFTINANTVYGGANLGFIRTLIEAFWYFVISYFIVKDIGKKINKIKSGDIEHVQEDNIKEDLL